jgi:hypothetical protein
MVVGSDTVLIIGVFVFVSVVTVNGVLLVDTKVMVGGVVLSLDVDSESEMVSKVEVSALIVVVSSEVGGSLGVESENEIVVSKEVEVS